MKILYRQSDGWIGQQMTWDLPIAEITLNPGIAVLEGYEGPAVDADSYYVSGSPASLTLRPSMPASLSSSTIVANGVDAATLSGIPLGASIQIFDSSGLTMLVATDTFLDITSDEPGTIDIRLILFPYLMGIYTVTAT